jgi:hypothetical protein
MSFWVDSVAAMQLRVASVTMWWSVQAIMEKALDDWFTKQQLPALARKAA